MKGKKKTKSKMTQAKIERLVKMASIDPLRPEVEKFLGEYQAHEDAIKAYRKTYLRVMRAIFKAIPYTAADAATDAEIEKHNAESLLLKKAKMFVKSQTRLTQ